MSFGRGHGAFVVRIGGVAADDTEAIIVPISSATSPARDTKLELNPLLIWRGPEDEPVEQLPQRGGRGKFSWLSSPAPLSACDARHGAE